MGCNQLRESLCIAAKATVLPGKRRFEFSRSDMDRVAFVGFGLASLRSMAVGRLIGWTPSFTRIAMGSSSG
jgi:hypothetical protein